MSALDPFSPVVRDWFERTFDAPTPAQERGWPAIASGSHTLIQAPTGSGKTLAAFLWALDRAEPGGGVQVLYVSPLKALNYDVERNLRGPLAGIGSRLAVAVRTGDTPPKERAAMLKSPPPTITVVRSRYTQARPGDCAMKRIAGRIKKRARRRRTCAHCNRTAAARGKFSRDSNRRRARARACGPLPSPP